MPTLYQWAMLGLTLCMVLLTLSIAWVVVREEWLKLRRAPVTVSVASSEDLGEEGAFAFEVDNVTGQRISGGSPVLIQPRNVRVDGEELNLFRFPPHAVESYLLGNQDALSGQLNTGCPMYCQTPAAVTNEWRGFWATYLDVAGGDKKKRIKTEPFAIYRLYVDQIEGKLDEFLEEKYPGEDSGEGTHLPNAAKLRENEYSTLLEGMRDEYRKQVEATFDDETEQDVVVPEEIIDFIFPSVPIDIDQASEIQVDLKNIGTATFTRDDGEWVHEGFVSYQERG